MKMSKTATKYRYIFAVIAFGVVIIMIIAGLFSIDNATNKMIVAYLEELGWRVEPSPREIVHLTLPEKFDVVYETYNAVQKHAGFDLEPFRGKSVTRYTYRVLNHKRSEDSLVVAGIFVCENTIIAGEISSAEMNGFMHAVTETSNLVPVE